MEFGRFQIVPHRRELKVDGTPVPLGSRAFDIACLLIEARGELVTKDEIMQRVWPDTIVEENSLHVTMSSLRKTLGAHRGAIRTVPGRGYQLIVDSVPTATQAPPTNLPVSTSELIGREEALRELTRLVDVHRIVTLTGPGGIGKTRLALEMTRGLLPQFPDGVWLAELGPLTDARSVGSCVAGVLGLEFPGGITSLAPFSRLLAGKRLLVVLDNCEHVIDAAAAMAEAVASADPALRVVATSREPLRVRGEALLRVPPLDVPANDVRAPDEILQRSAVKLFVERVRLAEPRFSMDAGALAAAKSICRRLDGIPLAIELAAARAAMLGVAELAAGLDDRFRILTGGLRTALPRHRTLQATLDWSYDLLPVAEQQMLCALAAFVGEFTLDAALAVGALDMRPLAQATERLANLVAKSLVVREGQGPDVRYRLLETTRAYAAEKLRRSGSVSDVSRRHAGYFRELVARAEAEWPERPTREWLAAYSDKIDDIKSALDWAFSPAGDVGIGIELTAASAPLWFQLSLVEECRLRVEAALAGLAAAGSDNAWQRMRLQAALGLSLIYTKGMNEEAVQALTIALELAEELGDVDYQLRGLWGLWVNRLNNGRLREALHFADRFHRLAARSRNRHDELVGERVLGATLHFLGEHAQGRRHIERVLERYASPHHGSQLVRFHYDQRLVACATLGEILWVQGHPEQALAVIEADVDEAVQLNHAVTLCVVLAKAAPVAIWAGDAALAKSYIDMLLERAMIHGLALWQIEGRCIYGTLQVRLGDRQEGVEILRGILEGEPEIKALLRYPSYLGDHAEGLAAIGKTAEGLQAVELALLQSEQRETNWCMPELLRIKGDILRLMTAPEAEGILVRALESARLREARGWELRAAMSLGRLRHDQGRTAEARDVLMAAYGRFDEGFDTADLAAARSLLDAWTADPRARNPA
jgi:predicted ATPase/DNA-binding winged helix-turn-helix (wHTH) protein